MEELHIGFMQYAVALAYAVQHHAGFSTTTTGIAVVTSNTIAIVVYGDPAVFN